ncbi:MAG: sensor histidine kinase [Imperialibacter sp.]|uniref:sensor histidine kinase n=1 Tax=Imperialibacter sp. TaxID=2038411 RepID=UPI003A8B2B78
MQKPLQFRISAALKNIIGSDLISDDYIAIFELVKNAYDAHASRVEILFDQINSPNAKIVIKDNGKGMNYDDLINKWLFVAYSAKKEGTEEDGYNYRDRIKVKRAYAGAKGIGRFSCDRLGRTLYLETIKDETNSKVETLLTEWDEFEGNIKDEFVDISVLHDTKEISNYDLKHGTVLEISNLKSEWDREKFLKLKSDLAKLINPNTEPDDDLFEIELKVPQQLSEDKKYQDYGSIVNGKIQNLIFETLDLKTTKIISKVSDEVSKEIETTLFEGGIPVYRIVEENLLDKLHNVDLEIYYLNRSAKSTFTRRMGVEPVNYGHVFVYKNGVRIYPYGERGEDPFKIDNRKVQGPSRYLGTREILGYISIKEPNDELRETTSRGDGLLKTKEYFQLIEWFYQNLKRVERYIIDVVDWGNFLSEEDYINFNAAFKKGENGIKDVNDNLVRLIESISSAKNIKAVQLAPDILEILDKKSEKSVQKSLKNISDAIEGESFDKKDILNRIRETSLKLEQLKKAKDEAEEEALDKGIKNEEVSENLERQIKKGAFQGALIGTDKERIISMQHQVYHSSSRIHRNLRLLMKKLDLSSLDEASKKYIKVISLEASKINSIANFITKANFNLKASEIDTELVDFIVDYLKEIYIHEDAIIDTKLRINLETNNSTFETTIRPLEITTILDNFVSNAEKAGASFVNFNFHIKDSKLEIQIVDDGKGIHSSRIGDIFDLGYTTTGGSGIGLYQIKDIIENKMNGEIDVKSELNSGTTFKITIP